MISFESFDFDIIVLIIVSFTCIFGAYYGAKRETKHFLNILLPLLIMHFSVEKMFELLMKETKVFEFLKYYISLILNDNQNEKNVELIILFLFSLVYYIVLFFIIFFVSNIFKLKNEKLLLIKETKKSRLFGALLGILEGYIISAFVLSFVSNIFVINYDKPITNFVSSTSKKVSYVSQYDIVNNAYESYEDLYYQLMIVFGEKGKEIYQIAIQDESFSCEMSDVKDDVLKEYLKYLEQKKDYKDYKTKIEIENYLKYKKILIEELDLQEYDLDEYYLEIKNHLQENPNEVLTVLRNILKEDDFYECASLLKKTEFKELKIDNEENCFFEFVYEIILINYPDLKKINKLSKSNVFINYYMKNTDLTNKELLIEYSK